MAWILPVNTAATMDLSPVDVYTSGLEVNMEETWGEMTVLGVPYVAFRASQPRVGEGIKLQQNPG